MKSALAALAVLVALIAGSGLIAARSRPVLYGAHKSGRHDNFVQASTRPLGVVDFTGDGSVYITVTSWKHWNSTRATGQGQLHVRSCWGKCAVFKTEKAAIRLYRVRQRQGHKYFTRLHYAIAHKLAGVGSRTLEFHPHGAPAWRPPRKLAVIR
jgi:hypothetical protein